MQRILLIEPVDRHDSLRDVLEAGGADVMLARVARSSLTWPLSRPTLIVLHGFAADRAADLLAQLRTVGFDMPALIVTTANPANGHSAFDTAGYASAAVALGRFVVEGDGLQPVQLGVALAHIAQAVAERAEQEDATADGGAPADVDGSAVATTATRAQRRRRGARDGARDGPRAA